MSLYFVNVSNFMGLVAKKMQEKKNLNFLTLWARSVGEENEEHDLPGRTHVLSCSCSSEKKKFNSFFLK